MSDLSFCAALLRYGGARVVVMGLEQEELLAADGKKASER